MNKQMETFSFSPSTNLVDEEKWFLALTSFETTNSVLDISDENKNLSITTSSHWNFANGEEPINQLNDLLELRSENDIELILKEAEKRRTRRQIEKSGYNLPGFDHFESEILAGLKRVKNKDLEDSVYGMQVTDNESVEILDVKCSAGSTNGYTLPLGIFETCDLSLMIKSLLPN